jgi:hypothetical protein
MARCKHCGASAIMFSDICNVCWDRRAIQIAAASAEPKNEPLPLPEPQNLERATSRPTPAGSESACICLGVILGGISVYFLVVAPGAAEAEVLGRTIVNLQRLAIGETSRIAAAVFLAAGMRPR